MWTFFYRHTRLLALSVLLLSAAGLVGVLLIPRAEDPRMTNIYSFILTEWNGATAERVESQVTEPIEDALGELGGVKRFRSTSGAGVSIVQLELKGNVSDPDAEWARVRARLSAVADRLPSGAGRPQLLDLEEADAFTMLVGLRWALDTPPEYGVMGRVARELENRVRFVHGTEYTRVFGAPAEEIRVSLDGRALAEVGLSPSELASVVLESDAKAAAGRVWNDRNQFNIEVAGEFDTLSRLRSVPVLQRADGAALRLGDIATVTRGVADPPQELALLDGEPGITVAIRMDAGQRVDRWSARIHETLEAFEAELGSGIAVEMIFDQGEYVNHRLSYLSRSFFLGVVVVFAATFFMLGWRSGFVVGTALPLSVCFVLAGLLFFGGTIQQTTIMGMVLSLGLLIDNAIIMVDSVRYRLGLGMSREDAVRESCRRLAMPLFGSTLTTILAFTPLIILPGGTGDFVRPIGVSVVYALIGSLLLSLTVVPALAARAAGPARTEEASPRFWKNGFATKRLTRGYRRLVAGTLAYPALGVGIALALPVVGFAVAGSLGEQFFPPAERDQFRITMILPGQTGLAETAARSDELWQLLDEEPEIVRTDIYMGSELPQFYYNLKSWERQQANVAHAIVRTERQDQVRAVVQRVQQKLDRAMPSAQFLVRELEQGPTVKAPIELRVQGPDLDRLHALGTEVRRVLVETPGVVHTSMGMSSSRPKLRLKVDEEQAAMAGLSRIDIARELEAALEGVVAGSISEQKEEIPVRVRIEGPDRTRLDGVASYALHSGNGAAVPLEAIGEFEVVPEYVAINHWDTIRQNEVYGYLEAGLLPATVLKDVKERLSASGIVMPEGYRIAYGGEEESRDEAVADLMLGVPLLLLVMFGALVLSFNSFRCAALVAFVGILSVGPGIAAVWFFDYPLGFMAIIGILGLIGVAINDSIVVLAAIREDEAGRNGDPDAVEDSVMRSTRHVVATSVTTMAGFTPLFLNGGQIWPPMAVVIGGGVFGATLLSLFFVPSLYVVLQRRRFAASHRVEDEMITPPVESVA